MTAKRLGAARSADFVDEVDVVWTAPIEGNDPRCVVGWYRNARLYRYRQNFQGLYPSDRYKKDEIDSFRVRAKVEDAFLIDIGQRNLKLALGRGPGWSGQASWWYAEDTENLEARRFVQSIRNPIKARKSSPVQSRKTAENEAEPAKLRQMNIADMCVRTRRL
ncbi:hypothetical protein [Rhizobium etli]|uniref:hypothetical protein n=1 Tax=Rhizobium etli TaxID=29449 RepID=UPI000A321BED|nr:hypothetical protein [Rhizobium etli]